MDLERIGHSHLHFFSNPHYPLTYPHFQLMSLSSLLNKLKQEERTYTDSPLLTSTFKYSTFLTLDELSLPLSKAT